MLNKLGRISKWIIIICIELGVIWYGMGCPQPTDMDGKIKLFMALAVGVYTAWKNHDLTETAERFTKAMRKEKLDG